MAHISAAFLALCALAPSMVLAQNAQVKVVLSDTFRTPAPPNDAFAMNTDHVIVSTAVMASIALFFMVVAYFDGKKFNDTIPLAIIVGSAFCVVPEAVDNYLGGCYWSQSHDPNMLLFFLMGREYDAYVGVMWWAFGAILGYVLYAMLLREVSNKTLWIGLALSGLGDIIVEEVLLNYGGVYMYFGHQPLVLITMFPFWWLFSNVSSLFLSISIAYRYRAWLNGWRSIAMFALMPFCYIGGFTLSAMPTIFVIQGNFSPLVTQLGGLATVAVSLIQTFAMFNIILDRNPFALSESPKSVKLALNGNTNGYANGHTNGKANGYTNGNAKKGSKF
ncbi:hypothetical protein BU16DRAFT_540174 [Lophium mytilinum]|uniref:Family A G protein-coupled receptor-like protein n=1 Tax=Lophium mytilinum TaxID=390894 RepID=A0A6A6QVJ7_9PEZI|nr:hypothetical protein BU16DRAFT_540174 [Lophium mytilinum]